jgi:peptide/nickel transport system substrate-binding protein
LRKIFVAVLFSLILVSLLSACSSQPSSSPAITTSAPAPTKTSAAPVTSSAPPASTKVSPQSGGTLKIILTGGVAAIGTLGSPTETVGGMYGRVAAPAMEYLFSYDTNERFIPQLAESWNVSPDGKSLTIKIRQGVKFQDGTPLNAQAVKENFDLMKAATNSPNWKSIFANVASWEVVNEFTIKVNFTTFDSNFMVNFALQPLFSPSAVKTASTPENIAKDHMVGTGPFKFVSYLRGQNVKYIKWDGYWQPGKPYLDALEINEIADFVVSIMSFKKGEAQLIFGISPKDAIDLKAAGFQIIEASARSHYPIVPDGGTPDSPFANLKVRQAVEYAIDKKSLASLGQGYYEVADQMATPTDARYVKGLTPRSYDPAKAKQLLAEAGFAGGFKTTLVANSTYNKDVLTAIQMYLKDVGIDGTIDMADAARFADLQAKGWKGLLFSGTPIVGNLQSMWNRFGGQTVPSMYRGPTFQQKMDAGIAEPDYDKRMGYLQDMVKLMYDDAMMIPTFAYPTLSAADQKLHDVNWTQGHPNMWNPWNAWLSK